LTVWTDSGSGTQVIDDVRRTVIAHLKAQRLDHWRSVPPADTMNGAFAGDALLDTNRVVLAHGSPSQQATFMHIATNSIQCCWQLTPDGLSRNLRPLWCTTCDVPLTLTHLTQCADDGAVFRSSQQIAVQTVLSSDARTLPWLNANRHLSLTELLVQLFPRPPDTPMHLHVTHVMCGVFSARQANEASKLLGFARAEDGRRLMQQLRLCCVDGIHTFFQVHKNALP
jgi:hypothetical protein